MGSDIITSVDELKRAYYRKHPDYHFFDRDTLKFFGERLSDMRVLKDIVSVTDIQGNEHKCYVLSSVQRNHPMGPKKVYHYFDVEEIDQVFVD